MSFWDCEKETFDDFIINSRVLTASLSPDESVVVCLIMSESLTHFESLECYDLIEKSLIYKADFKKPFIDDDAIDFFDPNHIVLTDRNNVYFYVDLRSQKYFCHLNIKNGKVELNQIEPVISDLFANEKTVFMRMNMDISRLRQVKECYCYNVNTQFNFNKLKKYDKADNFEVCKQYFSNETEDVILYKRKRFTTLNFSILNLKTGETEDFYDFEPYVDLTRIGNTDYIFASRFFSGKNFFDNRHIDSNGVIDIRNHKKTGQFLAKNNSFVFETKDEEIVFCDNIRTNSPKSPEAVDVSFSYDCRYTLLKSSRLQNLYLVETPKEFLDLLR